MTKDEEYKLFLDHAVGLTQRRQTVTTTYLSVNTAIAAAIAFLVRDGGLATWQGEVSVLLLLASGIIASSLWRRLLAEYSTLIGWWYEQIRILEEDMQGCTMLITKEYDKWYSKKSGEATIGLTKLTHYERGLALIFTIIYSLFALGLLVALIIGLV